MKRFRLLCSLILATSCSSALDAQSTLATITGIVTDANYAKLVEDLAGSSPRTRTVVINEGAHGRQN